jgi:preprotein translocase subunit SecD
MRKHPGIYLSLIVALAILAGAFVYPGNSVSNWRPWTLGLDLVGGSHLVYEVDLSAVDAASQSSVLSGLREVIERRVNLFGVSEPQVYIATAGERSELIVELAGIKDVNEAIKVIGETPLLQFAEVEEVQQGTSTVQQPVFTNLTGQYVVGAELAFDRTTQQPHVNLKFNDEGAKIFEQITEKNVGKPLAVYLDGALVTAPIVQTKITGGEAQITGKFTIQEARDMVQRFNAGALPAPIHLIDQLTVSPTLGTQSLQKGVFAGGIGTGLVALFMMAYYGFLGIFAAAALVIYIALTLGLFKLIPITMTLAGLAGFIITIGMAVDANILIFERTKEEMKRGLSRTAAIHEGFLRAWPSIRDSNLTTILSAIILYFFTSSFVQGFALTLFIGTLVSMFSAITTTRLLLMVFVKDRKDAAAAKQNIV